MTDSGFILYKYRAIIIVSHPTYGPTGLRMAVLRLGRYRVQLEIASPIRLHWTHRERTV